ncbi:MAG: hypothetical protein ACOYB2_10745 [Limnohabitans sp.]
MAEQDGLVVGQTYSLSEIGGLMAGNAAITSEDRIVTEELAWERMTVGRLLLWLTEAKEAGEVTDESEVWVDSDPEGNGTHPMRAAASLVATKVEKVYGKETTVLDDEATEVDLPAPAVWFGVGY